MAAPGIQSGFNIPFNDCLEHVFPGVLIVRNVLRPEFIVESLRMSIDLVVAIICSHGNCKPLAEFLLNMGLPPKDKFIAPGWHLSGNELL